MLMDQKMNLNIWQEKITEMAELGKWKMVPQSLNPKFIANLSAHPSQTST